METISLFKKINFIKRVMTDSYKENEKMLSVFSF